MEEDDAASGSKDVRKVDRDSFELLGEGHALVISFWALGDYMAYKSLIFKHWFQKQTWVNLFAGKRTRKSDASDASPALTPVPDHSSKKAKGDASKSAEDDASSNDSDSDDGKEQEKILKSLQFPEIEGGSFSASMCPKIMKCLTKRLTKLEAHVKTFPERATMTQLQKSFQS